MRILLEDEDGSIASPCASVVDSNMEERERDTGDVNPSSTSSDCKATAPTSSSSAPSVPEHGADSTRAASGDLGDKLDVCSDNFDPLLALYSPTVPLPFPNIKCFNNVSEYESFLRGGRGRAKPENVEKRQRKAMKGVADPERIERLKKLMVRNPVPEAEGESSSSTPRRRKQKPPKNVLTRMPLCKGGPLGELHRCVEERIRVKVHIRTFKGLRGVCSGFIVAFDKFWNMAMVDVDETYRELLLGEALYHEKALTVSRLFEKLKIQESPEGDEQAKKHKAKGKASCPQSADPSPVSKEGSSKRGDNRTESRLSGDSVRGEQEKQGASLKARGPETGGRKHSQAYGKVHTRHVNQLFIRGENVILINPQPL
ncbi:U7 snRNA-associated Sm-like protein LSm11 [Myripristis murdjan]|uniref:U7 snRNA-associated Sm-like protein LSm11 n=1 Tax=Myripristis murdjan TaxID=586833 RepID=UPI00117630C9|nr:U7 snRNA-associated Sm-like protein LSm11 [Myripristis murdjan]